MPVRTILIVEDAPLNLELARDVLMTAGYAVLEARSADEGIQTAAALLPDLILLDIRLPGADGFEAMSRLRADPRTSAIPVVAPTAQAMQGDRERALALGFTGYITKPSEVRSFRDQVQGFLDAESPARRAGGS